MGYGRCPGRPEQTSGCSAGHNQFQHYCCSVGILRRPGLNNVSLILGLSSLSLNFSTTQQDIISTVNRIQAEVQAGKREGSVISKTAAQSTIEDSESLLDGVLKELEEEGVSSKDIAENRSFIVQWILKGIQGGAWEEQPEPLPLYSLHKQTAVYHHTQRHGCKIEILSAAWGGTIVTERLRQFFMTHTRPSTKMRAFVPSNTFMGIDPLSGKRKLFIMVWRRRWFSEGNALSRYSAPQVVRCFEDQEVMLDYDANLPPSELVPLSQNGVVVLDATYGNKGVTASVSRLIRDGFRVENSLLGGDPLSGVRKSMVLTYSYGPPDDYLDCYIRVVREEEELWIPPRLTIHAACWSTADITEGLRAQVDQAHQTLSLVTGHALSCSDPWFGIMKTYAILYQYGEDPSQLIVANDRSGVIEINPRSPVRRGFFNPIPPNHRDPHVVAAVWGMQHISLQQFGLIPQMAEIPCTNEWFGFDGWENHNKTFLVFVQDPRTEVIKCFAQREGQELVLPFNQPQHLDLYRRSTMEAVLDSGDSSPDLSPSTDYG